MAPPIRALLAAALVVSAPAVAQDEPYPIDFELLTPAMTPDGGLGLDSPRWERQGSWSLGALFQYERAPLRLFEFDNLIGHVVAHRSSLQLAGYAALPSRFSLGFNLPVGMNLGSTVPELAGDGVGLGDLSITGRWGAAEWGPGTLGLELTGILPTGAERRYLGERTVRLRVGAAGWYDAAPYELLGALRFHVRAPVRTEFDFVAGSELELDLGIRRSLDQARIDLLAELLTRIGIGLGDFGGRMSTELLLGARYHATDTLRLDAVLGRGITEGYGTTGFRVGVGLTYVFIAPPPPPPPEEDIEKELIVVHSLPEEEQPEPEPEPIAKVERDQIVFRDPIQFEFGKTRILPESLPTLEAIADLLEGEGSIGHVVIEGHASVEGSYAYNYELSRNRAAEIYEALVDAGVHPDRMSYRGMGEVDPARPGDDEASLSANRRVRFHIVRVYQPGEDVPELPTEVRLPWTGEPHTVVNPPPPEPPEEDLLEEPAPEEAP